MIASILNSISLCTYNNINTVFSHSAAIDINLKEELALSTPLDVTEVNSSSLMIVVIFGNMVGDAFLSAMVVTREFGLIGELFHMFFQSAIS